MKSRGRPDRRAVRREGRHIWLATLLGLLVLVSLGVLAVGAFATDSDSRTPMSATLDAEAQAAHQADLATKQAATDRENALIAYGEEHLAPFDPSYAPPAPGSPPPWPHGLFGKGEIPRTLSSDGEEFESVWKGESGSGKYLAVYAGSWGGSGYVLVDTIDPVSWSHSFQDYYPTIPGAVTIQDVRGTVVTLVSTQSGAVQTLDLSSGSLSR